MLATEVHPRLLFGFVDVDGSICSPLMAAWLDLSHSRLHEFAISEAFVYNSCIVATLVDRRPLHDDCP